MKTLDIKTALTFAAAALSAYAQITAGQASNRAESIGSQLGSKVHWVTHRLDAGNKGRKARFRALEARIMDIEARCHTTGHTLDPIPLPGFDHVDERTNGHHP